MSCSPFARLLALSLRNHADDFGVFEWKPIQIKMRCLPADNVDVQALLAELEANNQVRRYEVDGKAYGAIRNFCRFQRPEKASRLYPRQDWVPAYCAERGAEEKPEGRPKTKIDDPSSNDRRPVGDQSGKKLASEPEPYPEPNNPEDLDSLHTAAAVAPTAPPPDPEPPRRYAWEGMIIRLVEKDLERWKASFTNLDVVAEVAALDAWLASDDATDQQRRKWFHLVAGALARKNAKPPDGRAPPGRPPRHSERAMIQDLMERFGDERYQGTDDPPGPLALPQGDQGPYH
ncbi:hypothetical protein [Geminicoccus harenae]|uniref:hypothetical protein n=1 Tax=Geminicoccus harenae TaxID=2498453 RepID=UPI00168BFC65|nr:hypothetical protein [Geminicoccus harenae]